MKIRVRLYGMIRKAVGKSELEIELEEGATVGGLAETLAGKYPEMEKLRRFGMVSLNQRYAKGDELLKDGDVVSLFPPVAGG